MISSILFFSPPPFRRAQLHRVAECVQPKPTRVPVQRHISPGTRLQLAHRVMQRDVGQSAYGVQACIVETYTDGRRDWERHWQPRRLRSRLREQGTYICMRSQAPPPPSPPGVWYSIKMIESSL